MGVEQKQELPTDACSGRVRKLELRQAKPDSFNLLSSFGVRAARMRTKLELDLSTAGIVGGTKTGLMDGTSNTISKQKQLADRTRTSGSC